MSNLGLMLIMLLYLFSATVMYNSSYKEPHSKKISNIVVIMGIRG